MSSAVASGGQVEVPDGEEMGWEVELGVVISKTCFQAEKESAMDYVGGYVTVLDLTGMKSGFDQMSSGHSWTRNKICTGFKPIGRFIDKSEVQDPHSLTMICKVNGKVVAKDSNATLKFTIPEQIADASSLTCLQRGDVLLIGSGALGPLTAGDFVEGSIEGMEKYVVSAKLVKRSML